MVKAKQKYKSAKNAKRSFHKLAKNQNKEHCLQQTETIFADFH